MVTVDRILSDKQIIEKEMVSSQKQPCDLSYTSVMLKTPTVPIFLRLKTKKTLDKLPETNGNLLSREMDELLDEVDRCETPTRKVAPYDSFVRAASVITDSPKGKIVA